MMYKICVDVGGRGEYQILHHRDIVLLEWSLNTYAHRSITESPSYSFWAGSLRPLMG